MYLDVHRNPPIAPCEGSESSRCEFTDASTRRGASVGADMNEPRKEVFALVSIANGASELTGSSLPYVALRQSGSEFGHTPGR